MEDNYNSKQSNIGNEVVEEVKEKGRGAMKETIKPIEFPLYEVLVENEIIQSSEYGIKVTAYGIWAYIGNKYDVDENCTFENNADGYAKACKYINRIRKNTIDNWMRTELIIGEVLQ